MEITKKDIPDLKVYTDPTKMDTEKMHDDFNCFNTWTNNTYLSPEQLKQMEDSMVFYVSLAVGTDMFE